MNWKFKFMKQGMGCGRLWIFTGTASSLTIYLGSTIISVITTSARITVFPF